jgi:hypothetical protein
MKVWDSKIQFRMGPTEELVQVPEESQQNGFVILLTGEESRLFVEYPESVI